MAHVADHLSVSALEQQYRSCTDVTAARHLQAIWLLATRVAVPPHWPCCEHRPCAEARRGTAMIRSPAEGVAGDSRTLGRQIGSGAMSRAGEPWRMEPII